MAVAFLRGSALAFATLLLGSCSTPNAQYQTDPNTVTIAGSSCRESESKYRLRAIEFDEQGIRWSNEQRSSALAAIRDTHPNVPYLINGEQARGYWIVQVPKEIIDGHGGIFNESAINFIAGLYNVPL